MPHLRVKILDPAAKQNDTKIVTDCFLSFSKKVIKIRPQVFV